jgi:hypothetical protein
MKTENNQIQTAAPQLPANPFAREMSKHVNAGTVEIEASRAVAEAQGKLLIAKRFPRNQAKAFAEMMESCSRVSFATQAMYSYPRGGQTVSGPSIRMAEELARNWGNIEFGTRELSRRDGESEMEAYAWDLETNLVRSIKFTVKHLRDKKGGAVALTDERDIYEVTANMGGRRVRACLLAVLPPDYVDSAVQECAKTLAGGNQEPLVDRVKKMLVSFAKWNVTSEMIEARIGKKVDDIFAEDIVELIAIHNSIRDGQSKPSDWFGDSYKHEGAPTVESLSKKTAKPKGGEQSGNSQKENTQPNATETSEELI